MAYRSDRRTNRLALAAGALLAAAALPALAAEMKHEWVGDPDKTIMWTGWVTTEPGTLWDTQRRDCWTTWSGQAIWYTVVYNRTCVPNVGITCGTSGPGINTGYSYPSNPAVVNSMMGMSTVKRHVREEKCLFTSSTPIGANATFNETRYTHQGLNNGWVGATVTFDGRTIAQDESIDLLCETLGMHQYVVSRTDGKLTDAFTFNINVLPSYTLEFMGYGPTINPSAIVRFTNLSPDDIDADFSSSSGMLGVMTEVANNRQTVAAGASVDLLMDFYTADGYVREPDQMLFGDFYARFGDQNGKVISSLVVSVPAPAPWLALSVAGAVVSVRSRRRQAATR